ncbi:response regulator [Salinibius halmophilus]|uniref:response regulator n=1 Tax=Salinibius halmophilus TaxID=1853216 RepID=UPI000E66A21C|nr:response regulator [Salinibius halmophilus]
MNLLIVEDEVSLAEVERDYLLASGYDVEMVHHGDHALSALEQTRYDLVVLDLMLPGTDGIEICKQMQAIAPQTAIIMTTARVEEVDRLLGLELGADDYLCKPFSPRELVARVKAILRRARLLGEPVSTQGLTLNEGQLTVSWQGKQAQLTAVEFNILSTLIAHPGRIYSRDQLMDHAYSDQRVVSDRTIDSHVKKLRKKIEQIAPEQAFIRSVYGAGYQYDLTGN